MTLIRDFNTQSLPPEYEYLAPDGSEIRSTFAMKHGGVCHCRLPVNGVTQAKRHKTVEEFWYFIQGKGQVWRKTADSEIVTDVAAGICLNIPTGTRFQFRNSGSEPLEIIIFTMPPWPGASEAEDVEGHWKLPSQQEP